jgi:hypothetical protein
MELVWLCTLYTENTVKLEKYADPSQQVSVHTFMRLTLVIYIQLQELLQY